MVLLFDLKILPDLDVLSQFVGCSLSYYVSPHMTKLSLVRLVLVTSE